jgi:LuxR family maltose regulon positive regulatory protein
MFIELYVSLEVPAITRARIWVALGTDESLHRAYTLLQEISKRARSWHFTNQTIEADVLKSLALAGLGREDEALECLAGTIDLAAPGGWMRPFLEPGKPMADLLGHLDGHGLASDFSRQLHSAIKAWLAREASHARTASGPQVTPEAELYETLTPRELDVLELLAQRLQNKEISDKLFVSLETVKSHLKNIYQKLDVGKRREAVEKARKIGLV